MRNFRGNGRYTARYPHDESGHGHERQVLRFLRKRGVDVREAGPFEDEVGKVDFVVEGVKVQLTSGTKSSREVEELRRRGITLVTVGREYFAASYREEVEDYIADEVLRQAGLR